MTGLPAQFLIVTAGRERYALRLEDISEVMESFAAYPIPNAPPCLIGVINFHGSPVPVLDLAAFLHGTTPRDSGNLLVLDHAIGALALCVDRVERILTSFLPNAAENGTEGFMGPSVSCGDGGESIPLLSLAAVVARLDEQLRGRPRSMANAASSRAGKA